MYVRVLLLVDIWYMHILCWCKWTVLIGALNMLVVRHIKHRVPHMLLHVVQWYMLYVHLRI